MFASYLLQHNKQEQSILSHSLFFFKRISYFVGFFLILFSIEYDKVFGYYSIGSHLSVMLLQSNLMPFRLAVFLLYCAPTPPFFLGGGVYLHITSCPCGEGILFLSCPSVRLSFWQSITKVTLPTSWNRIPLNYVCLLITVWRITYHYSLQIGQFS